MLILGACQRSPSAPPTLGSLEAQSDVKEAGTQLMTLAEGLHRLDTSSPTPTTVVIGVHGHDSAGYEWRHPMVASGKTGAQVHFYRWDYEQCPTPMAAELDRHIDELLAAQPSIERVQVIGHSYGGVITMLMAAHYDGTPPLTADVVASPLAGASILTERCEYPGPLPPAENVTLRQWRTQQRLDGAFEKFDVDPQVVDLPGEVTRLPDTYKGHRLGHNWSISWVVDHLAGNAEP